MGRRKDPAISLIVGGFKLVGAVAKAIDQSAKKNERLNAKYAREYERAVLREKKEHERARRDAERAEKALDKEIERMQNQEERDRIKIAAQREKEAHRRAKEQAAYIKEEQKRFFEDGSSAYKLRCESREAMLTAILESVYR